MSFTVEKFPFNEYVHFVIAGKDTPENTEKYWMEIVRFCKQNHFRKILVEEKLEGSGEIFDVYLLFDKILPYFELPVKIAFFDHFNDEVNDFAETVAINRGINAQVFHSLDEARNWLLKD